LVDTFLFCFVAVFHPSANEGDEFIDGDKNVLSFGIKKELCLA